MPTPYEEGLSAGFRNEPKNNPYRKGWREYSLLRLLIEEWDCGYNAGQLEGRYAVQEKRIANCK